MNVEPVRTTITCAVHATHDTAGSRLVCVNCMNGCCMHNTVRKRRDVAFAAIDAHGSVRA